jgi:hypothetical protein
MPPYASRLLLMSFVPTERTKRQSRGYDRDSMYE